LTQELLKDKELMDKLSKNILKHARPDAAEKIAREVLGVGKPDTEVS